jgi:hypothetical protein
MGTHKTRHNSAMSTRQKRQTIEAEKRQRIQRRQCEKDKEYKGDNVKKTNKTT